MSKYNLLKSKPDNDIEWMLQIIANELAEKNRIMRAALDLELMKIVDPGQIATFDFVNKDLA